jgi:hypothetical protein
VPACLGCSARSARRNSAPDLCSSVRSPLERPVNEGEPHSRYAAEGVIRPGVSAAVLRSASGESKCPIGSLSLATIGGACQATVHPIGLAAQETVEAGVRDPQQGSDVFEDPALDVRSLGRRHARLSRTGHVDRLVKGRCLP